MAKERELYIVAVDSRSVISNANQLVAAFLNCDVNACRACIERVLNQLLYHGCRTLDYLAGSDLIGDGTGKHRNCGQVQRGSLQ